VRFARVEIGASISYCIIEGETAVLIDGPPYGDYNKTGQTAPLAECRLRAPVEPSKIVCVGLNYADHAAETGTALPEEPCLFMKPSTAVTGPNDDIIFPRMAARVDHEAELGVVIAKRAAKAPRENWRDFVLGYTCFNDVTARDLQAKDGQWTRAKGFDTFAPVGPWIETGLDPSALSIQARVNGEVRQDSNTRHLIFDPSFLIPFISEVMTLLPGDIIATGTPAGISGMSVGDTVEIEIGGIGVLRNTVAAPEGR